MKRCLETGSCSFAPVKNCTLFWWTVEAAKLPEGEMAVAPFSTESVHWERLRGRSQLSRGVQNTDAEPAERCGHYGSRAAAQAGASPSSARRGGSGGSRKREKATRLSQ